MFNLDKKSEDQLFTRKLTDDDIKPQKAVSTVQDLLQDPEIYSIIRGDELTMQYFEFLLNNDEKSAKK